MFELPQVCEVNKIIPKKSFYENLEISSSIKEEFINKIEKVTWLYKLSEDTLNLKKNNEIEEIQIFKIDLKEKYIPQNIVKTISKGIPYKILFVIKFEEDFCFGIKVEDFYFSEWNEKIEINFKGYDLTNVFENIVKAIIKDNSETKTFNKIIENKEKVDKLNKQISQLENKIKSEKQFDKKVELNIQLNKLKKELNNLYG